jgi:riboflavin kinase/FMN adenylyltransferase
VIEKMRIFHQLQDEPVISAPAIFTFGVFDGVHLGHQFIFEQMKKQAALFHCPMVCLTFSNHPSEVLFPEHPVLQLTSHSQKIALLQSAGFDCILDIPFDKQLQQLSALEFIAAIRRMVPFSSIITGTDVSFGKECEGDKIFLGRLAEQFGFHAAFFDRYCIDEIRVSSSHIRPLVISGDFAQAERFLGRPYSLAGTLIVRSKEMIRLDVKGLITPPYGAYAASVQLEGAAKKHRALALLTLASTIEKQTETTLEVYLLDTYEEQNAQMAEIHFLKFLRPDRRFSREDDLRAQIEKDKQLARSL